MQVKRLKFALSLLLLSAVGMTGGLKAQDVKEASTDTLMKHIMALSSQEYQGRQAGTDHYFDAAQYVIDQLKSYGVKPYQGEWYQLFETECNVIENASLYTHSMRDNTTTEYVLGNDFVCASMTGSGYTNSQAAFCGYGIDHASYNEYAGMDVKGKVVIVMSGVPNFMDATIAEDYNSTLKKAKVAQSHGAHALVVINMSQTCPDNEVQLRFYGDEAQQLPKFPILQVTKVTGSALFDNEPKTFEECCAELQNTHQMQSFLMDKKIEIDIDARYNPKAVTANVVGVLPGYESPYNKEYLVVGAHLDHVGTQGTTCMFPGADDNASGVAAVLETARLLSKQVYEPARRSVMFVFFADGELQNLGSQIFCSNIKPLKAIEAFINAECIGTGDSIVVLGNEKFPMIYNIADSIDRNSTKMMAHSFVTAPRGDAAVFSYIGIPSLVFSTLNGNKHVHTPSDISEDIDRKMVTKAATLMFQTVYELTWGDYQGRSRRSKAFRF